MTKLKMCEFANCAREISAQEGVGVSYAGYRQRYCCTLHASWALLDYSFDVLKINNAGAQQLASVDPKRRNNAY